MNIIINDNIYYKYYKNTKLGLGYVNLSSSPTKLNQGWKNLIQIQFKY